MSKMPLEPIDPNTFQASFTLNNNAVNLILRGLGKLPAEDSFDMINAMKNGFEQQLFTAQRAREEEIKLMEDKSKDQPEKPSPKKE